MKKYLFPIILFLLFASRAEAAYVEKPDCADIPNPSANRVTCKQTTNANGRLAGHLYNWNGSAWIDQDTAGGSGSAHVIRDEGTPLTQRTNLNFTGSGAECTDNSGTDSTDCEFLSGHVVKDEGVTLTSQPNLNFTGSGITCTNNGGASSTDCNVPAQATDQSASYTWTGTHSFVDGNLSIKGSSDATKVTKIEVDGQTTGTTRTWSGPDASTRLIGDSDFSGTGILTRTGTGTFAVRSITGATGNISITSNAGGVAGNPLIDVGSTVVQTDQSNTYTTGDQDMSLVSSFTTKKATGYAPTTSGLFGYDTTGNRFVGGVNGATRTFAFTSETQPLNSNLTALSGLTGAANTFPMFSGVGTMTTKSISSCGAGQAISWNGSFVCVNIDTGLTGLTTGKYLIAASATTADTSGSLSETGGVVSMSGLNVGSGIKGIFDFSGLSSSDKTYTFTNFSGTVRTSTGAITAGHVLTVDANGQIIDGGAAGSGTWTDSSTSTGDNKTLVATGAGGTNTITIPVRAAWPADALTLPSGSTCSLASMAAINSGPSGQFVNCTDAGTSTFEGQIPLPQAVATVTFTLTVNDVDSSSHHFGGDFSAMCRNNNTTVNNTWGTSQSVDITMTTANNNYTGTTSAVTPNGTCGAGATLFWRFVVNTTPFTDDGDARVISVLMKQAS